MKALLMGILMAQMSFGQITFHKHKWASRQALVAAGARCATVHPNDVRREELDKDLEKFRQARPQAVQDRTVQSVTV